MNPLVNRSKKAAAALVVACIVGSCGRMPDVAADPKAERTKALCLAWKFGTPRRTLTDAARGGREQKLLAEFLSPGVRDDDPAELTDALRTLHASAQRLKDGTDAATVLADAEQALATTDRFYEATCPPIIAADQATSNPTTTGTT